MCIDYSFKKCLSLISRLSQNLPLTTCYFSDHCLYSNQSKNLHYYQMCPAFSCLGAFAHMIYSTWNILCYTSNLCFNFQHFKFHNRLSPGCVLWDPGVTLKEYRVRTLGNTGFKGLGQNLSPSPLERHSQRFSKPVFPSSLSMPLPS